MSVCNYHEVNDKLIHVEERQPSYLLSSFQTCPNFSEEQFIHRGGEKGTFVPFFKKQKAFETYVNNTITARYLDIFAEFRLWLFFFRLSLTFASSLPSPPF